MAKRAARKSTKKSEKVAAKSKTRPRRAAMPAAPDTHAHIDCCDLDFTEGERTLDKDLPGAFVGRLQAV